MDKYVQELNKKYTVAKDNYFNYFIERGITFTEDKEANMCYAYDKNKNLICECKGLLNYNNKITLVHGILDKMPELDNKLLKYLSEDMSETWCHLIHTINLDLLSKARENYEKAKQKYLDYFRYRDIQLVENRQLNKSYALDENMNIICEQDSTLFFCDIELLDEALKIKPELKTGRWAELKIQLDKAKKAEDKAFNDYYGFVEYESIIDDEKEESKSKKKLTKHIHLRYYNPKKHTKKTEENDEWIIK